MSLYTLENIQFVVTKLLVNRFLFLLIFAHVSSFVLPVELISTSWNFLNVQIMKEKMPYFPVLGIESGHLER